jgi:hypothetical protein
MLCAQAEAGLPLFPDTGDGIRGYLADWDTVVRAAT